MCRAASGTFGLSTPCAITSTPHFTASSPCAVSDWHPGLRKGASTPSAQCDSVRGVLSGEMVQALQRCRDEDCGEGKKGGEGMPDGDIEVKSSG